MDILFILAVLYIVLCYCLAKNIVKCGIKDNGILRRAVLIASIVVLVGCLTPINFRYGFILGYVIVCAGWLLQHIIYRKQNAEAACEDTKEKC